MHRPYHFFPICKSRIIPVPVVVEESVLVGSFRIDDDSASCDTPGDFSLTSRWSSRRSHMECISRLDRMADVARRYEDRRLGEPEEYLQRDMGNGWVGGTGMKPAHDTLARAVG